MVERRTSAERNRCPGRSSKQSPTFQFMSVSTREKPAARVIAGMTAATGALHSPLRIAPPRVVDEDAAHGLRRCRHEMGAVLPVHALVIDQPQVGFV